MKKILILCSILLSAIYYCNSQSETLVWPDVWLKSEASYLKGKTWSDISGHGHHAIHSGQTPDYLNFNPALVLKGGDEVDIPEITFNSRNVTTMLVYKVDDAMTEQGLWQLKQENGLQLGLTSRRILNSNSEITYENINREGGVINSLSQSWDSSGKGSIKIGHYDNILFNGLLAEFLFFDSSVPQESLLCWASYLAIKYGVTLIESDYFSSTGEKIWDYETDKIYSASIIGLGKDSLPGLDQRQSMGMNGKMVFGLGDYYRTNEMNPNRMNEGDFLIIGNEKLSFDQTENMTIEGNLVEVYGKSLVKVHGQTASGFSTFLKMDISDWEVVADEVRLVIDRSGSGDFSGKKLEYYVPTRIDSAGIVYFHDIKWDIDGNGKDLFCFIVDKAEEMVADEILTDEPQKKITTQEQAERLSLSLSDRESRESEYLLYPNPNYGQYTLMIRYPEIRDVVIKLLTIEGKVLREMNGKGNSDYRFEGEVSTRGQYLFEIESGGEKKNMKMIVN